MGELAAITAAFTWALGNMVIRMASGTSHPAAINAVRLIAPSLLFPAIMFGAGMQGQFLDFRWHNYAGMSAAVITGVGIADALLISTMRTVGLVRAFTIAGTYPLFSALLAVVFLGETLSAYAIAGTFFVVVGGGLVTTRSAAEIERPTVSQWVYRKGLAFSLLTAAMWGADALFLKIGIGEAHPVVANSFRMPLAAVFMHALAWHATRSFPVTQLGPRRTALALAAGVVGLTAGSALYLYSLQEIGAARAAGIGAISPVMTMLLAIGILRERPGMKPVAGTLVAAAGVGLLALL